MYLYRQLKDGLIEYDLGALHAGLSPAGAERRRALRKMAKNGVLPQLFTQLSIVV